MPLSTISSNQIKNDTIVDADINSSANINLATKVTGTLPVANGGAAEVPAFMLTTTESHTVTNNTQYDIPLTVKTLDTHDLLDTSDYTVKFTTATAGTYFVVGRTRLLYSPTRMYLNLNVNGSNIVTHGETTNANAGSGSYQSAVVSFIHTFANADQLKLRLYFLATANQSLYGGDSTSLHGFRIRT